MTEAKPTDQRAWIAAALDQHGNALLRYAAHIIGDADAARDVVQDTFLKLIALCDGRNGVTPGDALERDGDEAAPGAAAHGSSQSRGSAESACERQAMDGSARAPLAAGAELNGRAAAWLFTVCRNRALDVRRKEKRMIAVSTRAGSVGTPLELIPAAVPPPSAAMELRESTGSVLAHLARLPNAQQEVVRLRFQGGLTYRQIAEVTGLTVNNVGFLLHTALKTLRARLIEAEGGAS
ncbi:MAG: sigma-70 family RNA polymerase sigma factor [Phycisphaerales bacterium]|nr:MAG: sigma-70 family RNA polymerase sigma factor [Phycisphaerales bacterium]